MVLVRDQLAGGQLARLDRFLRGAGMGTVLGAGVWVSVFSFLRGDTAKSKEQLVNVVRVSFRISCRKKKRCA